MNYLQQFQNLRDKLPRLSLVNLFHENSDYCNYSAYNKNCYLIYASDYDQECINSYYIYHCEDSAECAYCSKSRLCFECIDVNESYGCNYSQDLRNCTECEYCFDCIGCTKCFGCVGLRRKEYHIFNEKVSREEYDSKIKELKKNPSEIDKKVEELRKKTPILYSHQLNTENCTGDYVYSSKDCFYCFDVDKCQDVMYMHNVIDHKDSMDCTNHYHKNELDYECVAATYLYNCNFCYSCFECQDLTYAEQCYHSHDLFLCINRDHAEYEILNQKYSKDEYFKKKAEIIEEMKKNGEWGKNIPSTYPYSDSVAATFWPEKNNLSKFYFASNV